MKVLNNGTAVVNLVLSQGPVALKKGDSVEMPEWVFKSLKRIFPGLEPMAETIIESKPEPIIKPASAEPAKPAKKPTKKARK